MKKDTNHSQTMERWGGIRYTGIVQGSDSDPLFLCGPIPYS